MKLLEPIEKHLNCCDNSNQNEPFIQHLTKIKGEKFSFKTTHAQLLFLLKGEVKCSFKYLENRVLKPDFFLLIPRENDYVLEVEENAELVAVKMPHKINFCTNFPLELLFELNKEKRVDELLLHFLEINEVICDWLQGIVKSINYDLKCSYYQELKQKEILYYLRAYYSKEELYTFFSPMLSNNIVFSNLIYQNYESVKNINELAGITNYSMSGFKKKFAKVFGISPAVWIKREKAKKIYYEINCSLKTFKEISNEYNFSSPAQFNKFCKKMYSMPPGTLRKNTKKSILSG